MATTGPTTAGGDTPGAPNSPRRGGNRGRGQGRQPRGGVHPNGISAIPSEGGDGNPQAQSPGNRARGRGRGRGGRGGRGGNRDRAPSIPQTTASVPDQNPTAAQPPPQPGGNGVFGGRLTKDADKNNTTGETAQGGEGEEEAEVCFICASPVAHQSVAPCNHRTCHICALRLRALYKTKACAHCRTEAGTVIFTDDGEKRFEDFESKDFSKTDANLGIAYEKPEIFEDTVLLLRYNCPDKDCDVACLGWPDLHRHVKAVHHKTMCDLCIRNKKVFAHEHELFTQQELRKHEKYGDDNPGAVDQSGFKGHPECGFCRQRFYGDDELYAHCRDKHERCHVCDRRTGGQNPQYYLDHNALEQHFGRDHFPCLDTECLEKKFVVFDSAMDLKAHQLEAHPNGMSKDVRRDARRVDISAFDYRPQYVEPRRGGRRGGGRGRDPNSEPMPAAPNGHMSRAELAHQREREIQSAQSVSTRTFGGQLSTPSEPQAQTVHRPAQAQSPRPAAARPANPLLHDRPPLPTTTDTRPTESLTPQEQARRLRHNAVTERAANLLGNEQTKLAEFRERISAYRTNKVTATDLIDAFFSLFDTSAAELGKLVKELADLFEITEKKDGLLKAWSDWKAINEDYPSLPGPSGSSSTAASVLGAGIGGNRVLKLKSSTARSERAGQQRSWNNTAAATTASKGNAFPALPSSGAAPQQQPSGWLSLRPAAAANSNSNSASNSTRPSPTPSRAQSSAQLKKGGEAFPALPPGKKPTSTVFSPGYTGSGVIRQSSSNTSAFSWGAGGGAGAGTGASTPLSEEQEVVGGGKGKGKKGKQVLFQWG
ncbi:uncharacterized protein LTR77_002361 [Saxophila tyrrhenica]|uniref:RING-type E3 ubiquitin transferase n=1 Tax=Saxophila tyrrhenica TaxID=1690608 RepID=A0AAV9PLF8_9PEZI|nr:hypothetical protein LTR77_002361 [Saxophila tyrrhenica]